MGFQFNHVGGGTKTRRPITLHMKYNSECVQPRCYLMGEEFGEQDVALEELQVRRWWDQHCDSCDPILQPNSSVHQPCRTHKHKYTDASDGFNLPAGIH
jgi:hypothetical protein